MSEERSRDDLLLLLASMFRPAPSPDVTRACLSLLARVGTGETTRLTRHALDVMLEEESLGAPAEDVWETLVASRLFREDGGALVAGRSIAVADLFEESAARDSWSVAIADVADVLEPEASAPMGAALRDLAAAIRRTQAWGLKCCEYASREQLGGMPVFWECKEGEHVPFGADFGTMAASDLPLLWAEGFRYGMPPTGPERTAAIGRAWSQLLDLGNHDGGWYEGAVAAPYFDDDFVGAFSREQAELGSCPTTEATAERLYALCLLRAYGGELDPEGTLQARSGEAIAAAARCLLRWQDPGGAWGIHRYEPGSALSCPVRDVSSRYACEALLVNLAEGDLEDSLAAEVRGALRRFADFLGTAVERNGERASWGGDFVASDEAGRLRATTLMASLCGALGQTLDDPGLATLQGEAIAHLRSAWEPDVAARFGVAFRSPTWEGLALTTFTWEMPADALVVSALLDWNARGGELGEELAGRILAAAAAILEAELHGHWFDLLMAEEGELKAFGSNSLHYLRCLLATAAWQSEAVPPALHPGILGSA